VLTIMVIVIVLAGAIGTGVYVLLSRVDPLTRQARCEVTTPRGTLGLSIEQAGIAATIAAVAARRKLPERAVVIAYATGIQESKLLNLPFGDRDSVGVFQQRPSQGWGTAEQLLDPVYATNRFFAGLVKVKNYRKLPLHEAAQAVQRSADGTAYAQHENDARILAAAFTGRVPGAVYCSYPPPKGETPAPDPAGARKHLARALGAAAADGNRIKVRSERHGWLVAAWSVAHAQEYGLRAVRYRDLSWTAEKGDEGWTPDGDAPTSGVEIG
jgi:hypothetical protein